VKLISCAIIRDPTDLSRIIGFPAIENAEAKILILGSMPSEVSLLKQQYYGHNRNAFWPIMMTLFSERIDWDYCQRQQILLVQQVAVWDVLQSCQRKGSLDTNIVMASVEVNDFITFFNQHRKIDTVFFNGAKAEAMYRKYVLSSLPEQYDYLHYHRLPSTSPAHAAMSLEEKTQRWRTILQFL